MKLFVKFVGEVFRCLGLGMIPNQFRIPSVMADPISFSIMPRACETVSHAFLGVNEPNKVFAGCVFAGCLFAGCGEWRSRELQ